MRVHVGTASLSIHYAALFKGALNLTILCHESDLIMGELGRSATKLTLGHLILMD